MTKRLLVVWLALIAVWAVVVAASENGCGGTSGQCASGLLVVAVVGLLGGCLVAVASWVVRGRRS